VQKFGLHQKQAYKLGFGAKPAGWISAQKIEYEGRQEGKGKPAAQQTERMHLSGYQGRLFGGA
jgi:hypothetical protein